MINGHNYIDVGSENENGNCDGSEDNDDDDNWWR